MMRPFRYLCAMIISAIATVAMGAEKSLPSSGPLDLMIELKKSDRQERIDGKKIEFKGACEKFGNLMSGNRGLWGTGPFSRIVCAPMASKDSGNKSEPDSKNWTWKLTISAEDDDNKTFAIRYRDKSGKITLESSYSVKTPIGPLALMDQPRISALIAAHLSVGLPFRSVIKGSQIREGTPSEWTGSNLPALPLPKGPLQVYTLRRVKNTWQPSIVATGQIAQESPSTTTLTFQIPIADVTDESHVISPKTIYFAHQITERESARIRIHEALLAELVSYYKYFFDIGRSAYVGVRYGMPMGKGTGVLATSPITGVFGEFRDGPLSGFKVNFDIISPQQLATETATEEFSWSRLQLSYAFGLKLDTSYVNWIDIAPKLGVTNLVLLSVPSESSSAQGYEFRLQNAPTLGAEIGVEQRSNSLLTRVWVYSGSSLGLLKLDQKYSNRVFSVGVDAHKEVFASKKLRFAALGFATFDSTTYKKNLNADELAENPEETTSISYSSIYIGGGITLKW